MINKRIAISGMSILAALGLMAGGTFAFFSDNETSTNNVFTAGTLDLVLCDSDENTPEECALAEEGPQDGTDATFGGTNMEPGGDPTQGTLTLKNNGSIDGNHVDIEFSNEIKPVPGAEEAEMDKYLEVTTLTYGGNPILPAVPDGDINGNDFIDLDDLESTGLVNLNGIPHLGSLDLVMAVGLHESAPSDLQGDSVNTTLDVTLQQAPHGDEIP